MPDSVFGSALCAGPSGLAAASARISVGGEPLRPPLALHRLTDFDGFDGLNAFSDGARPFGHQYPVDEGGYLTKSVMYLYLTKIVENSGSPSL